MVFGRRACFAEAVPKPFWGRGRPSHGFQEPSSEPFWVFGRPCWEAMWCISGLGGLMLQILEAILWPRGLPRANMSDQKPRFVQSDDFLLFFACCCSMGLPCRGSYEAIFGARQAIPRVSGAILGSFLVLGRPCWEAMRGSLDIGGAMLQILEAILWPRWLPKANMNSQHEQKFPSFVEVAHFCSGELSCKKGH